MNYEAVIFDLDGTLVDTIADLTDAMNAALGECGFAQRTMDECKYFVGDGMENFVRRALPPDRCEADAVARVLAIYRETYGRTWADKSRPYTGIPELLDALDARGLTKAVFSNKPDEFTKLMVGRLLAKWQFAAVVGARPGIPQKPDPMVALQIARDLNVPPAQCLYVGDTNTDMQTANAAGMYAVGALWGFRSRQELIDNGAKTLIAHPLELRTLLG